MAHSVDRSFCPSRCFERGVCFAKGANYICVCYDMDVCSKDCAIPAIGSPTQDPCLLSAMGSDCGFRGCDVGVSCIYSPSRPCMPHSALEARADKPVISVLVCDPLGR
ncbi:unnamed protein product [Cylicocyclus nassatus]|uniref:Uncharacterized protein n=1 Tax=Cylicocyclus nassatus TaxID=53992 RepID=A0AA36GFD5_CYLNA|nr:unnamed protein product [Cylicocyclus nassatus]